MAVGFEAADDGVVELEAALAGDSRACAFDGAAGAGGFNGACCVLRAEGAGFCWTAETAVAGFADVNRGVFEAEEPEAVEFEVL